MNLDLLHVFGFEPDLDEEQAEYRRPPRIQAGTLELEAQSGVGEVHLSEREPLMVYETPSLAGLYFIQIAPTSPVRVVDVYRGLYGDWWAEWSDIQPFRVKDSGYLFSQHAIREPRITGRAITVPLETHQ